MATLVIDTHEFVNGLTKAGVPEKQARAIVEGLQKIDLTQVATKEDVLLLKKDLQIEIQQVKIDMIKWFVPLLLGQAALFALIVKWLVGGV